MMIKRATTARRRERGRQDESISHLGPALGQLAEEFRLRAAGRPDSKAGSVAIVLEWLQVQWDQPRPFRVEVSLVPGSERPRESRG